MQIYDGSGQIQTIYYSHSPLPSPLKCGDTTLLIHTLILRIEDDLENGVIRTSNNLTMPKELFLMAFKRDFSDHDFLMLFNEVVYVGYDDDALSIANELGSNYSTDLWFDSEVGLMKTFVYRVK